jgi:hypothetical protein
MDTTEVVKEVPQLVMTLRPDDKSVIHITEPLEVLMNCLVKCHFLEVLAKKLAVTGDSGKTIAMLSVCWYKWLLKLKYEEVRAQQKSLRVSLKCRLWKLMAS